MKKFLLPLAIIANITISLAAGPKQTAKANMNAFQEWKPSTISHFYWDERSQEQPSWTIYDAYHIKYSTDGKISACESENPQITTTYDDRERISRQELYRWDEETNEFLLEMEASYEYDPIVEDFIVLTTNTYQDRQSGEGIEIIRDADGNVTSVRDYYVNRYGAVEPGHMKNVRIEYGPDGTATDIYRTASCNPRPYDFYDHLTDIVWENTDGQILDADIDEYDSALFFGSNRIKSATLLCDLDPTVPQGSLRVDYDGESYTQRCLWKTCNSITTITCFRTIREVTSATDMRNNSASALTKTALIIMKSSWQSPDMSKRPVTFTDWNCLTSKNGKRHIIFRA